MRVNFVMLIFCSLSHLKDQNSLLSSQTEIPGLSPVQVMTLSILPKRLPLLPPTATPLPTLAIYPDPAILTRPLQVVSVTCNVGGCINV